MSEEETLETELERRREKRPPEDLWVGECSWEVRVREWVVGGGAVVAGTGSVFLEKRPILFVVWCKCWELGRVRLGVVKDGLVLMFLQFGGKAKQISIPRRQA
jgi:hypothetical protein